ncbi:hypothetical protein DFS34DRAFT_74877 [Phlyctochytrium arcticum]|nr:hypothetical protein DFS34DRAFT_74877 [Phlyctochytrium arcticum]
MEPTTFFSIITALLCIHARHTVGILFSIPVLSYPFLFPSVGSVSSWPFVFLKVMRGSIIYIRVRCLWKQKHWTRMPVESSRGVRGQVTLKQGRAMKVDEKIGDWAARTPNMRTVLHRSADETSGSYFWHLEYMTSICGFVDDIAIEIAPSATDVVEVTYYAEGRMGGDIGRNRARWNDLKEMLLM